MEFLLNRYRNLSVLLVAILAQLALLAYQVRSNQDVRLIRVWAVGAVTPVARVIEAGRSGASHFFHDYFALLGVREDYQRLKSELNRVEMENQFYRAELATAENARALAIFQASSQSKTVAAHVVATTTDTGATAIIDRGSSSGVQKGLAVITPAGIVGKVISVFSNASFVLLITDPTFAAGVVSQKHHVHGTLKGQGPGAVTVEYVQNEETVDQGEWFLASGDDGIFPRGTPVGQATIVRPGRNHKEIFVTPSGLNGLEDVLVVIDGVHGIIPDVAPPDQPVHLLAPPAAEDSSTDAPAQNGAHQTDLDRAAQHTRDVGVAEGIKFGDKNTPKPDLNRPLLPLRIHERSSLRVSRFAKESRLQVQLDVHPGYPSGRDPVSGERAAFIPYLSYLELSLLVTVYFSLARRSPVAGVFFGAGIGLVQDSLSHHYLGVFGIVKTLVGYFAGNVSQRFEVENSWVRLVLAFFFYFFHQFFYWFLTRVLLGGTVGFDPLQTIVVGLLNAAVAVPLFRVLDKLRVTE